ncbi:IS3 family transposase [Glaciimonas sp. GS1]|uniref:IS3 family transposase n=1 Tax=Glaciimonas soli TaxID=2590999 RepID=A0A843YUT8_9BURK|nr:IS3 family transposase [Glaciimonas soli]
MKKERIKRKIYRTRDETKSDIFDYIESFCNCKRRHRYIDQMSPLACEKLHRGS